VPLDEDFADAVPGPVDLFAGDLDVEHPNALGALDDYIQRVIVVGAVAILQFDEIFCVESLFCHHGSRNHLPCDLKTFAGAAGDRSTQQHVVVHVVAVEIFENVGAHLQFGGADKNQFQAIESCQKVGEGADGAPASEFADEGDAQAVQGTFTIDGVEIQERLRGCWPPWLSLAMITGTLEASAARRVVL